MTKKVETTQSVLGLVPQTGVSTSGQSSALALSASSALTPTEERIFMELHRQQTVIAAQAAKTSYAEEKSMEMRMQASDEFHKVASHLSTLNEAARGKDYEEYVHEFNHYNAQGAAHDLRDLVQVGAAKVREQVGTSLDLKELPAPKRNGLQRLLGG